MYGCAGAPWLGTKAAAAALRWFHVDDALACWTVCDFAIGRAVFWRLELAWLGLGIPTDTCCARSSVKSSEIVL
jgi:hypothetical protein